MSQYAPRIATVTIPINKIRDVIGPGGKVITDIVAGAGQDRRQRRRHRQHRDQR